MTPEILAALKRTAEMPADVHPKLGALLKDWRDRLQTEDARAALTDDLTPERTSKLKDVDVVAAVGTWLADAKAVWLAHADAKDDADLTAKALAAIAEDTLSGWAGAHDTVGAAGIMSAAEVLGDAATLDTCLVAARI